MTPAGLEARGVSYFPEGAGGEEGALLRKVSARFEKGRITLLSGEMGAGKTTLLNTLAGLLRPAEGEVIAEGLAVSHWTSAHLDRWRRDVGLVFQSCHLWAGLTVLENVILPMIPRGEKLARLRTFGLESLKRLGVAHLAGRRARGLSLGERQRVTVARALVSRPAFVLADEPTAHQDEGGVAIVLDCLASAAEGNATLVVASHDPRVLKDLRIEHRWHLTKGRIERIS